uniref:DUF3615 domain-containing protein n=1 Tax=Oryza nivara TaxID=4536 RepID=A0A0E0J503_ORYNI
MDGGRAGRGRGDAPFAGPGGGRSPRRRPGRARYSLEEGEGLGEKGRSEEDRPRRRIIHLVCPGLEAWIPGCPSADRRPRVRQSVLYSDRPRRSQGRRGQVQSKTKSLDEKNVSEVSSELSTTTADIPKFKALTINDSLSRFDSTERSNESTYDAGTPGSNQRSSKFVKDKPKGDSDDVEECLRQLQEYYSKGHVHTSIEDAWNEVVAHEHVALTALALEWGMEPPPDPFQQKKSSLVDQEAQAHQAPQQTSDAAQHSMMPCKEEPSQQILPIHQPRTELSIEEIVENGKKWMSEEVMVAFKKYIEGKADLAGHQYRLELCHQCFNVESYLQNFHHYNFNVKIKKHDSDEWNESMYFAEVKMILRRKYYFCCPLEPRENGHCYACRNQGMDDLRHPATGGFEMGSPDTVFPYMYTSD